MLLLGINVSFLLFLDQKFKEILNRLILVEREIVIERPVGWIKDALDEIYWNCEETYFYDVLKVRKTCVRVAELLENMGMTRDMYKDLSRSFREG